MSLISQRPSQWNSVVGQDRAITVLQSILKTARFITRGYIFKGVLGVGKTTLAYIMARALMCTGNDPLGCGVCPSCKTELDNHGDFTEIDAASNPGVDHARNILEQVKHPATTGKRRVIIIDEAHRLSREAWDVYLKPLEEASETSEYKKAVFIFVTNDGEKIPPTIQSRCTSINFAKVEPKVILGLLAKICTENKIKYELEALQIITRLSKGHVRYAINYLDMVASVGDVKKELVSMVLDDSLEEFCLKILSAVIAKDVTEAMRLSDEACLRHLPHAVIEGMFSLYARSVFAAPNTPMAKIMANLPNVNEVSATFLKWTTNTQYLTSDAMALLLLELTNCMNSKPKNGNPALPAPVVAKGSILNLQEVAQILGGYTTKE